MFFAGELSKVESLTISKEEVLRYLGYRAQKHRLNKRILQILDLEMTEASELLAPRGYFGIFEAPLLRREKVFRDAEMVAFGVCTIGNALEKRVGELFNRDEGVRGVVLDAVGSTAAEKVADLLNKEVLKWGSRRGLRATRRFSPGYGGWSVSGQDLIFGYLRETQEKTGVTLSPSQMMTPLKSVSFAVKLGKGYLEEINKGACGSCTLYGRCLFQQEEKCSRQKARSD